MMNSAVGCLMSWVGKRRVLDEFGSVRARVRRWWHREGWLGPCRLFPAARDMWKNKGPAFKGTERSAKLSEES